MDSEYSNSWYFNSEDGHLSLVSDAGEITIDETDIEAASVSRHVKAKDSEGDWKILSLNQFKWNTNAVSRQFQPVCYSRTKFLKKVGEVVDELIQGKLKSTDGSKDPVEEEEADIDTEDDVPRHKDWCKENVIGDCLDVHITNLVGPESSRMVRPVDSEHVETLKGVFRKKTTSFVVMAGLCDHDVDVRKLKKENMYQIETIGGNHTRMALQSLLAAGQLAVPDQLVKVKIYKDLSDTEALQVGYEHNQQALNAKQVTFMDVCKIIRKHLKDKSKREVTKEKAKLSQIFGYEKITDMNNNLKTHLCMARSSKSVFDLALETERLWRVGKIIGQPKKKQDREIKQTQFRGLFYKDLSEEQREEALEILVTDGWKTYNETLRTFKANVKKAGALPDMQEDEQTADMERDIDEIIPPAEIMPDSSIESLKEENKQLKNENEALYAENEKLNNLVAHYELTLRKFEGKRTDERQEAFLDNLNLSVKRRNDATIKDKDTELPAKKSKEAPMIAQYEEGELVLALYTDKIWYEAKITKKLKNGKFKVRYTLDGVRETLEPEKIKKRNFVY